MKHPFYIKTLPVLLLLFGISVLIRLPNINRSLSVHEEYATAISLRIMESWYEDAAAKYGHNPVMNYPGAANKWINNDAGKTGKVVDADGNFYYVTQPPFAYYFAYYIFVLLGFAPNVLGLSVINLILHFISALFIYFTVCLLTSNKARDRLIPAAFVAYCMYLFNSNTLWFQSNVYMPDVVGHVLFLICIYTTLKFVMRRKFFSPKYVVWYTILLFLLCFTSYLGIIFGLVMLVYSLPKVKKERKYLILIACTIFSVGTAVTIYVMKYGSIAGFEAYGAELKRKFVEHSTFDIEFLSVGLTTLKLFGKFKFVLLNYITAYFPIFVLIGAFIWTVLTRPKTGIVFTKNGYRFLVFSVIPVMLFHLIFLDYSTRPVAAIYGSIFLCALVGIFYDKLLKIQSIKKLTMNIGVVLMAVFMVVQYWTINLPGEFSLEGIFYNESLELGRVIRNNAADDHVVFVKGTQPKPGDIYYAKRNMQFVTNEKEAKTFLEAHGLSKGIIFEFNSKKQLINQEKVNL